MKKILLCSFYVIYNYVFLRAAIFFLMYAEIYLNNFFVPNRLLWDENGHPPEHLSIWYTIEATLLLAVESFFLLLLLYFIDRWFLKRMIKQVSPKIFLFITIFVGSLITAIFLASQCFGFYFPIPFQNWYW